MKVENQIKNIVFMLATKNFMESSINLWRKNKKKLGDINRKIYRKKKSKK